MNQWVGIVQALIDNLKLITVDEHIAGFDPGERNRFQNLLAGVGQEVTIRLFTHMLDDVREFYSQFAIMNHGRMD